MSKILDVEWQCRYEVPVDLDEIIDMCKYNMEKYRFPLEEAIDNAIDSYVSKLDSTSYYGWTEDASKQVKNAALQYLGGVQLSMFD